MADAIPNFKTYAEGEPIPPVDPEDIKRCWHLKPPWRPGNDQQSACNPGADVQAVFWRWVMIDTLTTYNLLTPWQHDEELDDAVFRIAATFPIKVLGHKGYKISGDEILPFDPNAFVQQLIEETGVSHGWEPVSTKVPEGGRSISMSVAGPVPDPKRQAQDLLWEIWKRFVNVDRLMSHTDEQALSDKEAFHLVTKLFDDSAAENADLVRDLEAGFRIHGGPPLATLIELERRAQGGT